jgi:hypothetical protein
MGHAMTWVSRIMAVVGVMVLPGIGGQWLDTRLGTSFLALIGFAFGMVFSITYLLALTKTSTNSQDISHDKEPKS